MGDNLSFFSVQYASRTPSVMTDDGSAIVQSIDSYSTNERHRSLRGRVGLGSEKKLAEKNKRERAYLASPGR
jgi:hypothetical protein